MKRWKGLAALFMMLVLCCTGCGSQKEPEGTYSVGDNFTYLVFEEDTVILQMGGSSMTAKGTWELKGDKIVITYENNAGEKEYTYNAEDDTITAPSGDVLKRVE